MITLQLTHKKYILDPESPLGYREEIETFTQECKDIPGGLSAEGFMRKWMLDFNTRGYLKRGDEFILFHNLISVKYT